jgi:hypothetical protein
MTSGRPFTTLLCIGARIKAIAITAFTIGHAMSYPAAFALVLTSQGFILLAKERR